MTETTLVPNNEHKLCPEARRMVRQLVVGGRTNNQIREALERAGYRSDLSDQAFSKYRRHPKVVEAVSGLETEAIQAGSGARHRRIQQLSAVLQDAFTRLMGITPGHDDLPRCSPNAVTFTMLCKAFVTIHRELSRLVDT